MHVVAATKVVRSALEVSSDSSSITTIDGLGLSHLRLRRDIIGRWLLLLTTIL